MSGITIEQRYPEIILDHLDLVTDRRLGNVQLARGRGKAEQSARGLEVLEAVKWR